MPIARNSPNWIQETKCCGGAYSLGWFYIPITRILKTPVVVVVDVFRYCMTPLLILIPGTDSQNFDNDSLVISEIQVSSLHVQSRKLNSLTIKVRYVLWPRSGGLYIPSPTGHCSLEQLRGLSDLPHVPYSVALTGCA